LVTEAVRKVDISVVVVNWNVARLLDICLRSVQREAVTSGLNVEILVVDAASEQRDFVEVVRRFPDVGLRELDLNRGYGAACNAGVQLTSGGAVLLLNPDTVLLPGSLVRLWSTLDISPHIGLVAPLLLNPDGSVQSMGYRFPGPMNILCDLLPVPARIYDSPLNGRCPAGNGKLPVAIDYALGAALLVRRDAFDQVGGFDEAFFMYSEEIDAQKRLAECGWTRMLAPDARVIHSGGQSTGQQPAAMQAALWESRARYFDRWSGRAGRRLIDAAVVAGTTINSIRNPDRKDVNRRIRQAFMAGSMSRS
jgi:N-acetylglucosaminyl-diphospho-decaprenol L-rhamnosyltransferase